MVVPIIFANKKNLLTGNEMTHQNRSVFVEAHNRGQTKKKHSFNTTFHRSGLSQMTTENTAVGKNLVAPTKQSTQFSLKNRDLYVAVKVMMRKYEPQRMVLEQQILFTLKGKPSFPQLLGSGNYDVFMFIVMELLGKSLSELRKKNTNKKFDPHTAIRVGMQITNSLKILHELGYIHRDVKPGNMCVGASPATLRNVYLLDFGLARQFKVSSIKCKLMTRRYFCEQEGIQEKGRIKKRGHVGFRGTMRYVSINVHERREQCACDDLISMFYSVIELSEGVLPWTRLKNSDDIARKKKLITFGEMCTTLYIEILILNLIQVSTQKCLPPAYNMNSPMPWETLLNERTSTIIVASQEQTVAENDLNRVPK
uniref:non-specific serine/threonine protein kinase n=1 Tax=Heterorhabditis bacteriophora TaxID=37862 RepID=A0A1I7XUX0_HETBA